MITFFKNLNINKKLILLVAPIVITLFIGMGYSLNKMRNDLYAQHRHTNEMVVTIADELAERYNQKYIHGEYTKEQAIQKIEETFRIMKFSGDNYIFLYYTDGVSIISGKAENDGKNLLNVKSPEGRFIIQEIRDIAIQKGSGFVDYRWIKPGQPSDKLFEKISYVRSNNNLGIFFGTGDYVDNINDEFYSQIITGGLVLIPAFIITFITIIFIGRQISLPIHSLSNYMNILSRESMYQNVPYIDLTNEIGNMAKSIEKFRQNMLTIVRLELEQEEQKKKSQDEHHKNLLRLADDFDKNINIIINSVLEKASSVADSSNIMTTKTQSANKKSIEVLEISHQTNMNAQTVASATEELNASIQEINRQITHSTLITNEACSEAEKTTVLVKKLHDVTENISKITTFIDTVANQTRLLALNASIEAQRAGTAGLGFTVVANEVKSLALQTKQAAVEITEQIGGVTKATQDAVDSIANINTIISKVSEVSTTIACAIEEQGAATQEIARSVSEVSDSSQSAENHMSEVSKVINDTDQTARYVNADAESMVSLANELRQKSTEFTNFIRTSKSI